MKLYRKSQLTDRESYQITDTVKAKEGKALDVLFEAQQAWSSLSKFRMYAERCRKYTYGNQWSDVIYDSDKRKYVSEEQYIRDQGKVPLKNNMIRQLVKTVVGQFGSNQTEPVCVASDRDDQKLGEMMTIVMRYAYSLNKMWEVDRRTFENYVISGIVAHKSYYGWNAALNKEDAFVMTVPDNRIFFDTNMKDFRYWDCSIIGEIHDISIGDLLANFSHGSVERAEELRQIYVSATKDTLSNFYQDLMPGSDESLSFLVPRDNGLCRVIEVWRKESKLRVKCHDTLEGTYYKIDYEELPNIQRINQDRILQGISQGIPQDDVPLIETENFIDRYWYARWLSPYGDVLQEMETPYWHKSHPYTISIYPFNGGIVHSFVSDIIDQQRYINRLITMVDFIMGASAKGVLLFPEDQIPDGMTIEDIADEWTRYNGVILFKPKPNGALPQQISTNATNVGAYEMLNLQLRLLQEISGVHGALQGKSPSSNTAASLYAQEAQNSATNLVDLMASFTAFREERDTKLMQVIQQFYSDKRYVNISGNEYSEEAKYFDPDKVKNVHFDLTITESPSTPSFRQVTNDLLLELFRAGAIDVKQLLENGAFPFSDRLLQSINKKEEEAMQQLAAMQSAQQAGQVPAGNEQQELGQIQQQIDNNTNPLMNQMMARV